MSGAGWFGETSSFELQERCPRKASLL